MGGGPNINKYRAKGDTNWITRSSDEPVFDPISVPDVVLWVMLLMVIAAIVVSLFVNPGR